MSHAHDGPEDIRVEFLPPTFNFTQDPALPHGVDIRCSHCDLSARRDVRHAKGKYLRALLAPFQRLTHKFAPRPH